MEPPLFPSGGPQIVRAAPGSITSLVLPLPFGSPPFHYKWSRAGASLDERFIASEDAGGVRLTVSAARTGDSGVYTLQASNAAGKDTTRVRLEVSPDEAPVGDDPPNFLRRLQDLTVKVGTRTRFLVEIVSSTECKVTWYRNERRLMETERVALVRDGNFWCADVATVSVDDAGRWTCTAENVGGRASCSAHLNVLVPKAYKRPEFVEELRALLTEQGTVSLECKVVGVPTPVLRWFKDSREIKAGDVFALTANAEDPTSLGTYTCEAVNCMGRAYSSSKVHVVGRGSREGSTRPSSGGLTPEPPPIFTKELEDQFVRICESLTLSCHIVVPPWPRSVVWYNKEGKIEPSERYHVMEDGVGGYLLEVCSVEWADEGEWKCVASTVGGRVGMSTCYVSMDVPKNYRKPRFMENLQAVLTEEGLVSFECKVVGFPTPVLSWFKDGQELKPGDVYQLTGTNSLGSYCCIARNCMGQASSSAELTVEDIQNQLNEEEKHQLFSKNQAPKFIQGLKSVEAKIDEPFRFTIKVAIPPEPSLLWYRDDQPVDESSRCHHGKEERGMFFLDIQNLEFLDQAEWKCVAINDFGQSVTSCFLKLIIPRHYKKPRFLENLQAILSDEGAVNLECKVIGVPQPILKWYKDGEELKPGDIHRIISGQDGTCCLGTYTCEAQNCMGIAASSASLLGFDDSMKTKSKKKCEEQILQRNVSLSTIHEERTSQMYDTPLGDRTLDDKGEISFSFDGKEVSVSLYETPDLTEEEALQIVEMYADQLSENVTEHNVVELPPLRFVKETSTSGNLLMEAIIIDVSPEYFTSPEEDLRTEADIEDISIADENGPPQISLDLDQDISGQDYLEKTMALLSDEKADIPKKIRRKKSDSQRSVDDYFSLSRDQSLSDDKKEDDTQMLSESDLQSFASAKSSEKAKAKSSKPLFEETGVQSSQSPEFTQTTSPKGDVLKTTDTEPEVTVSKPKRERRRSRSSRRSSSGSEKSLGKLKGELIEIPMEQPPKKLIADEEYKTKINNTAIYLSNVINDIQIIERDIILQSELMASAATATKSLEIIGSLVTPLSEMNSIIEAAREASVANPEINSALFNNLTQPFKVLHQSLTIIEKCIDVESDNKTLVKKTCVSLIEKCGYKLQSIVSEIKSLISKKYLDVQEKLTNDINSLSEEIITTIRFSSDTIKAKSLLHEASEFKSDEPSLETQHSKDTQRAIFELKSPLRSLLLILESTERDNLIDGSNIKNSEIILNNMSASIQNLQEALEQIESLSVKESTSSLMTYNTEIIESVMDSVIQLRTSFEQLSIETKKEENEEILKQVLSTVKQNLSDISLRIDIFENKVGKFDIMQSENKLEVLQKMAQTLIQFENNLSTLDVVSGVKNHMVAFHKNLTKVLENVIESNDASKYLSFMEICDSINRINSSVKNIESHDVFSLTSINNTLKIVQDQFIRNIFEPELNCSVLNNIEDIQINLHENINIAEEVSFKTDSDRIRDLPPIEQDESKAYVVLESIEQSIAAITNVITDECPSEIKTSLMPVLETIRPNLVDLKQKIASMIAVDVDREDHVSEISDVSMTQTLANPLLELNQNTVILHQTIVENVKSFKDNSSYAKTYAQSLHELQTTLEILQHEVVSQYGEDILPYEISSNIANVVQNLQNCIILIQEQSGVETADEMSTLEDISGIRTAVELMSSDHLLLPTTEEVLPVHLVETLKQAKTDSVTAETLQALHDHVTMMQNPDVVEFLESLSEISDYTSLKSVAISLGELNEGVQEIIQPMIIENANDILDSLYNSKLIEIAQPIQDLHQSLSVVDASNIPIYESVLKISSDKIHSAVEKIFEFKDQLEKCLNIIEPAIETADEMIEISSNIDLLKQMCVDLIHSFQDAEKSSTLMDPEVGILRKKINNFLDATTAQNSIDVTEVKTMIEELYTTLLIGQDDLVQCTPQPNDIVRQEIKLLETVQELENKIAVLEQINFVDLSRTSEIDTCMSPQFAVETQTDSLIQMDDVINYTTDIVQELEEQTQTADLMILEDFFKTCKQEFSLLRCLITKRPTHKKLIRLLQEFSFLRSIVIDFEQKRFELSMSPDVNELLSNFLISLNASMNDIEKSLIKIVNSQSNLLINTPIKILDNDIKIIANSTISSKIFADLINKFRILVEDVRPRFDNVQTDIIAELQSPTTLNELSAEKHIESANVDSFINFVIEQSGNLSDEGLQEIFENILNCLHKHHDYKDVVGQSKNLLLLKCLSECSSILRDFLSKDIEPTKKKDCLLTEAEETSLKSILHEIVEPLQGLRDQLVYIQEQISSGIGEESLSINMTSTESYVQALNDIQKDVLRLLETENPVLDETVLSFIEDIDSEVHALQADVESVVNAGASSEVVKLIASPLNDIEKSLQMAKEKGSVDLKNKVSKDEAEALMQHIDQYIEFVEIVEEISAIIKIDDFLETANIARELRESINEIVKKDSEEVALKLGTDQVSLMSKLHSAVSALQVQVLDNVLEMAPSFDDDKRQHIIEVVASLEANLRAIIGIQVAVVAPSNDAFEVLEPNKPLEKTTMEIDKSKIVEEQETVEFQDKKLEQCSSIVDEDSHEKSIQTSTVTESIPQEAQQIESVLEKTEEYIEKETVSNLIQESVTTAETIEISTDDQNDQKMKEDITATAEKSSLETPSIGSLVHHIDEFTRDDVVEIITKLATFADFKELEESVIVAKELQKSIIALEVSPLESVELLQNENCTAQKEIVLHLQESLNVHNILTLHNAEELKSVIGEKSLECVTEVVQNLKADIISIVQPTVQEGKQIVEGSARQLQTQDSTQQEWKSERATTELVNDDEKVTKQEGVVMETSKTAFKEIKDINENQQTLDVLETLEDFVIPDDTKDTADRVYDADDVDSMERLQTLLSEVNSLVNLSSMEATTEDTEMLRNILDEVQTVIIKLKRDFDETVNDTLNEALEDLECSVRSVQLQIDENSAPELLKDACATLQLLLTNMSDMKDHVVSPGKDKNSKETLQKCFNGTEQTITLLDDACKMDTEDQMINVISKLKLLKDILKTLSLNFRDDADILINNGIEVIQSLDQMEEQIFSLEKDIEGAVCKADIKDSIIVAVHSVYENISNMRSTLSSIQKEYMYENYARPSDKFLKSLKDIAFIFECDKRKNWKHLGKVLRRVLKHFEDIKFYVNLDKTARIPSDAAFTKIILDELIKELNDVLLKNVLELYPEIANKVHEVLLKVKENNTSIESRTTLEVKEKIPIFKNISEQILIITNAIREIAQVQKKPDDSQVPEKLTIKIVDEQKSEIIDNQSLSVEVTDQKGEFDDKSLAIYEEDSPKETTETMQIQDEELLDEILKNAASEVTDDLQKPEKIVGLEDTQKDEEKINEVMNLASQESPSCSSKQENEVDITQVKDTEGLQERYDEIKDFKEILQDEIKDAAESETIEEEIPLKNTEDELQQQQKAIEGHKDVEALQREKEDSEVADKEDVQDKHVHDFEDKSILEEVVDEKAPGKEVSLQTEAQDLVTSTDDKLEALDEKAHESYEESTLRKELVEEKIDEQAKPREEEKEHASEKQKLQEGKEMAEVTPKEDKDQSEEKGERQQKQKSLDEEAEILKDQGENTQADKDEQLTAKKIIKEEARLKEEKETVKETQEKTTEGDEKIKEKESGNEEMKDIEEETRQEKGPVAVEGKEKKEVEKLIIETEEQDHKNKYVEEEAIQQKEKKEPNEILKDGKSRLEKEKKTEESPENEKVTDVKLKGEEKQVRVEKDKKDTESHQIEIAETIKENDVESKQKEKEAAVPQLKKEKELAEKDSDKLHQKEEAIQWKEEETAEAKLKDEEEPSKEEMKGTHEEFFEEKSSTQEEEQIAEAKNNEDGEKAYADKGEQDAKKLSLDEESKQITLKEEEEKKLKETQEEAHTEKEKQDAENKHHEEEAKQKQGKEAAEVEPKEEKEKEQEENKLKEKQEETRIEIEKQDAEKKHHKEEAKQKKGKEATEVKPKEEEKEQEEKKLKEKQEEAHIEIEKQDAEKKHHKEEAKQKQGKEAAEVKPKEEEEKEQEENKLKEKQEEAHIEIEKQDAEKKHHKEEAKQKKGKEAAEVKPKEDEEKERVEKEQQDAEEKHLEEEVKVQKEKEPVEVKLKAEVTPAEGDKARAENDKQDAEIKVQEEKVTQQKEKEAAELERNEEEKRLEQETMPQKDKEVAETKLKKDEKRGSSEKQKQDAEKQRFEEETKQEVEQKEETDAKLKEKHLQEKAKQQKEKEVMDVKLKEERHLADDTIQKKEKEETSVKQEEEKTSDQKEKLDPEKKRLEEEVTQHEEKEVADVKLKYEEKHLEQEPTQLIDKEVVEIKSDEKEKGRSEKQKQDSEKKRLEEESKQKEEQKDETEAKFKEKHLQQEVKQKEKEAAEPKLKDKEETIQKKDIVVEVKSEEEKVCAERDKQDSENKRLEEGAKEKKEKEAAEAKLKEEKENVRLEKEKQDAEKKRFEEEASQQKEKEEEKARAEKERQDAEKKRFEEEARQQKEKEAAEAKLKEQENARLEKEKHDAEKKRLEEEATQQKEKEEEKARAEKERQDAEKKRLEEEARQQKEKEAAEAKLKEEEKARSEKEMQDAEEKRLKEEEKLRKDKEAAEVKQKEEEEKTRLEKEKQDAENKRLEEEAKEKKEKKALEAKQKEEEKARAEKEKQDSENKRLEEEAKQKKEKEAEAKLKEEQENARLEKEKQDAEKKRLEEEATQQKEKEEEKARAEKEKLDAENKRLEEEAKQKEEKEEAEAKLKEKQEKARLEKEKKDAEKKRLEEEATQQKEKEEEKARAEKEKQDAENKRLEEEAKQKKEKEEAEAKLKEQENARLEKEKHDAEKKRLEEEATQQKEKEEEKARAEKERQDAEKKRLEEEARQQKEKEAAEAKLKEEEKARAEKEKQDAENKRLEEEARQKKEKEVAEAKLKEQENARLEKEKHDAEKKRLEEEATQQKEKEEEKARAEKERQDAEKKRLEEEARQQKEKEAAEAKLKEEEKARAEKEKQDAENKRLEEEARQKKEKEVAEAKLKEQENARLEKEKHDAEKKRLEEEATQQKEKEEEKARAEKEKQDAEKNRLEEEAKQKKEKEEAEAKLKEQENARLEKEKHDAKKKRLEKEATQQKEKEEEKARAEKEKQDAEKKRLEEEAQHQKEKEAAEAKLKEEKARSEKEKQDAEKKWLEEEATQQKEKEEEKAHAVKEQQDAEKRRLEEEAQQQKENEAVEAKLKEEEKARAEKEKQDAENKRLEEEAKQKKEKEESEAKMKEEQNRARLEKEKQDAEKKRLEEEATLQKKKEEEKARAEKEKQDAEKKRLEEEARQQKEKEAAEAKLKEEEKARVEKEMQDAENKRLEEEAKQQNEKEKEALEGKQKEEEKSRAQKEMKDAENKRLEEEAKQQKEKETAEVKLKEEEKAHAEKEKQDAETKRLEEETQQQKEKEVAEAKLKEEEQKAHEEKQKQDTEKKLYEEEGKIENEKAAVGLKVKKKEKKQRVKKEKEDAEQKILDEDTIIKQKKENKTVFEEIDVDNKRLDNEKELYIGSKSTDERPKDIGLKEKDKRVDLNNDADEKQFTCDVDKKYDDFDSTQSSSTISQKKSSKLNGSIEKYKVGKIDFSSASEQKYEYKEKPHYINYSNNNNSGLEMYKPPGYIEKKYGEDSWNFPQDTDMTRKTVPTYKAQTLVYQSQLRATTPQHYEMDRSSESVEKRSEVRQRSKALSEARSYTEKRTSRDHKRKPVFSTYLTDRTAVEASRVKLTCSVLSSIDPTIIWFKNGVILNDKLKYRTKFVDGLITLEVLNAVPSDSAEYTCTVQNENGSVSTSANLKVYPSFEASPIPPTFTRSIRDTYHLAENELILECRIRGQPLPTITWLKDDRPISTDDRYQAYYLADGVCRLAISAPTTADSGKYTCKAENSMWSDHITHVVNFTGKESSLGPNLATKERSRFNRQVLESRRPHFTNVLTDYKVTRGGTIGLQVEIKGSPTRVEWLREGRSVTEIYRNAQTFIEQGLYTLALTDVTEKESGLYTCRAWSTHGNVDMNAAITVVQPNELEGKPAIIVGRPQKDLLISVGEDLNISFRVQGEPKPKVIFMKGIRDITNSQRVCKMTSDDYVKFTVKRSVVSDAGTYCILARNAYGCDRAFVTVEIRQRASSDNLISDWTYPQDDASASISERKYKSVPERIPGEPSVVDGGNNWVSLAWPKPDPQETAPVLAYKVESWLLGKEGGARWVELGITPLNSFDAFNLKQGEEYHFRVTPRNRYGWGEPVPTSTAIGIGLAGDRPEFTEILPGQLKVLVGETASLSCSFKGKPTPEIVWMKNGHEIEEDSDRIKTLLNGFDCCLTIRDVQIEDEARYSCEASNVHGRASTYARMAVITDRLVWEADAKLKRERSAGVEGEFSPQFTMRLRDRRVQATYPVRLTCQVIGSPTPTVTWFKDGHELVYDSRHNLSQDEHFHTLEIAPTSLEDGGVYEAMARNSSGAVSCRCSLVVDKGIRAYVAPEFCCGLEPLYRLQEGEELRISAMVEAYPSVGVTWYRDGVRLRPSRRAIMTLDHDGQIELALASVTGRDAGVYTCTASNEVGRASTSGKVEVIGGHQTEEKTRTPPVVISPDVPYSKEPMFIRKPRSSEAREGDTVIIECEVIGDPKPDVYWLRDFLKPDYYRDATHFKRVGGGPEYRFEIPHAKLDYTGTYSVVARNAHGEAKAIISLQILAKDITASEDAHNIRYGRVDVLPRFDKELTDLLCYDGDAIEFECRVSGNPEPYIKWLHYNEVVRDCPDFETSYEEGTARLKIKQVTAEDEGTYTCEASNSLGKVKSSACLVVYPPGEPNTLSQRLRRPPALLSAASTPRSTPRSTPARSLSRTPGPDTRRLCSPSREVSPKFITYPFNKVVEEGERVVFKCAVKGLPNPWATWDKDGIVITPTSRITIREKDEILRILEIEEVTVEDVGMYRITLENDYGRAEASARLEVITHKGKFYGGVRSYSPSPRRTLYRRRTPSTSGQD